MGYIKLRKYFFLESSIAFFKWLPTLQNDILKITIDDITLEIFIEIKYKETSDFGVIEENKISMSNHWIKTLFIILNVPVDDASDNSFYELNPPPSILSKVVKTLRHFESSFYSIVRNDLGQYWLPNSHEIDSLKDEQILTNIQIFHSGKWIQFCRDIILGESNFPIPDIQINQERWYQLKELITNRYRCDLSLVFYRNAEYYLRHKNFRVAMVEVCIALERAINTFIKNHMDEAAQMKLSPILNGNSLTDKVNELLPFLLPDDVIDNKVIDNCSDAVNLRNNIIHNSQVKIDKEKVSLYINEIKKILDKLNHRRFKKILERY